MQWGFFMQGSRIHSLCYTRNHLGLRLYAAILSMVWSDYNGRYCMGMGMIMQAEVLKWDLIPIQRQSDMQADGHWETKKNDLRSS